MGTINTQARAIDETTDLGIGFLIVESGEGAYEPVAPVSTIGEAREMASHDLYRRMQRLNRAEDPICPARYLIWARSDSGEYQVITTIEV